MEKLHIMFTDKNGNFQQEYRKFTSIETAELWLKNIGATYWEIGFPS